jgi:hypothetical protein
MWRCCENTRSETATNKSNTSNLFLQHLSTSACTSRPIFPVLPPPPHSFCATPKRQQRDDDSRIRHAKAWQRGGAVCGLAHELKIGTRHDEINEGTQKKAAFTVNRWMACLGEEDKLYSHCHTNKKHWQSQERPTHDTHVIDDCTPATATVFLSAFPLALSCGPKDLGYLQKFGLPPQGPPT